jgi:Tol biopolymer transport system component
MRFAAGFRLGHYEILAPLGTGGMGEVYRAADPRLGREVAIKILSTQKPDDEDLERRFEREARAASALNHPNILSVYDIASHDGAPYIVMELLEGESLRQALARGSFPVRRFLDVATQIGDALAAAHHGGIVHRDLKPENIMITRDGRVKIVDFGLARRDHAVGAEPQGSTVSIGATKPGELVGTIQYMSPEQARGEPVDFRSDQFSFGAVLYEMATGQRAFGRGSIAETLQAIISEEPPPLPERSPLPQPARWMITRCLSKNPSERYASSVDLYRDLRNCRDYLSVGAGPVAAPRSSRRWRLLVGAALFAAASLIVAALVRTAPVAGDLRYAPFAMEAGVETQPAWSPDGRTVAYVAEIGGIRQILTRSLAAAVPAQLTRAATHCGSPFWSPDGSRVFYLAGYKLWSVGGAGGPPDLVLEDVSQASISPDGKTIAFGKTGAGGGIWLYSLSDHHTSRYPAPLEGQSLTRQVLFSPDGTRIGALWPTQREHTFDNTFWLLPFPASPRVRSIKLEASYFSWAPDSRHIVAVQETPSGPGRHLFWVDTDTGRGEPLTSGLNSETTAAVSPDGHRIALSSGSSDADLVNIALDGSPLLTLLASSRSEMNASWSPDGTQYAYVQSIGGSTDTTMLRGGGGEIWLRSVQGEWSRPLMESFEEKEITCTNPRFAPDGQRIAFERWASDGYTIWVTTVGGAAPVRLVPERNHQHYPAWSPDGNWIAYRANIGDERVLEKAPFGGGSPVALAKASASFVVWSPTGESIAWGGGPVYIVSASGGTPRRLTDQPSNSLAFSRDGTKLYFIVQRNSAWQLWSVVLSSGEQRLERTIEVPASATVQGLTLHPDGARLTTSVVTVREDIWLLEGFRQPGSWWTRLWRPFR